MPVRVETPPDMDAHPLLKGILLGLAAAAPIGPVNVEIARRAIRLGFRAGAALGAGAMTVDVAYLTLVALGFRFAANQPRLLQALGVAGGLLLVYLGIMCLRSARQSRLADAEKPIDHPSRHYLTGLLITALNPMTLAFWFLVTPGQTAGSKAVLPLGLGVLIGTLGWALFFSALMTLAGSINKRRTEVLADIAGGLMLIGFGVYAIWRVFARPLS